MAASVRVVLTTAASDRILYARHQKFQKAPVVGGTAITPEIATGLRVVVFGTCTAPPRGEWMRTGITFREPEMDYSYCLKSQRNTTRCLMTVLQAEILRNLLFVDVAAYSRKNRPNPEILLRLTADKQTDVLIGALSEILWRIGGKSKACLVLPQSNSYLDQSPSYYQDGITEKLHIFEVTDYDELQILIKRYLYLLTDPEGSGAILILYSAVITRTIHRTKTDMEGSKRCQLVSTEDEGSLCVVTLLLTGRATPFLHNGVVYIGDEDHYAVAQYGILSRSEVGLLVSGDGDDETKVPGSRLKTPSKPIWVVYAGGHYAVIYNTNADLLYNYHAERRFDLNYMSCGGIFYQLIVDTRRTCSSHTNDDAAAASIEGLIHTKWPDAHVTWVSSTQLS